MATTPATPNSFGARMAAARAAKKAEGGVAMPPSKATPAAPVAPPVGGRKSDKVPPPMRSKFLEMHGVHHETIGQIRGTPRPSNQGPPVAPGY